MLSFVTLDGEAVRFDGNFTILTCDFMDEEDEKLRQYMDYFAERERNDGIELYVYAFVCTGGKPIWGVASYGEQWDTLTAHKEEPGDEGETFLDGEASCDDGFAADDDVFLTDEFYAANEFEKRDIEAYARQVVIPHMITCCQQLDDTQVNIVDFRKAFYLDCIQWGYYHPDIADTLRDNEFSNINVFTLAMRKCHETFMLPNYESTFGTGRLAHVNASD